MVVSDWASLLRDLQTGESDILQFFSEVVDFSDIAPSIVAMANTKGGVMYIGIDTRNYHLSGTKLDRDWLESYIDRDIKPSPNLVLDFIVKGTKTIAVIQITSKPPMNFYYKEQYYVMNEGKPMVSSSAPPPQLHHDYPHSRMDSTNFDSVYSGYSGYSPHQELPGHQQGAKLGYMYKFVSSPDQDRTYLIDQRSRLSMNEAKDKMHSNTGSESISHRMIPFRDGNLSASDLSFESAKSVDFDKVVLNSRQKKALMYIKKNASIKNKDYRDLFKVSHKTAHVELVDMVSKGYITTMGAGRSRCYVPR